MYGEACLRKEKGGAAEKKDDKKDPKDKDPKTPKEKTPKKDKAEKSSKKSKKEKDKKWGAPKIFADLRFLPTAYCVEPPVPLLHGRGP